MAREIKHLVQPYRLEKRRLIPADALPVRSAPAAKVRAEKLYGTGRYAGVDAYTVTSDDEAGEYGDPVFLVRLGRVPDYGDD